MSDKQPITPDKIKELVEKAVADEKFYGHIKVGFRLGKIGLVEKMQTFEEL